MAPSKRIRHVLCAWEVFRIRVLPLVWPLSRSLLTALYSIVPSPSLSLSLPPMLCVLHEKSFTCLSRRMSLVAWKSIKDASNFCAGFSIIYKIDEDTIHIHTRVCVCGYMVGVDSPCICTHSPNACTKNDCINK